jgi:23S rRNA (uracil1939-C5)-methyltransferase
MDKLTPGIEEPRVVSIESLEQEARGVGHWQGKTIFIDGALPGERVEFSSYRRKPAYEFARPVKLLRESAQRVHPRCPHYGVCGGCSLQHFEVRAQLAAKQRTLEDALWHIGRTRPEQILPAVHGPAWGYRQRARLAVRHVVKKGGVLVGFHERSSSFVADMTSCEVLPDRISLLLPRLRELIAKLSVHDRLPQIEVACGDAADVLVLRILRPLIGSDEVLLREFADRHGIVWYLQPGGPASAQAFYPLPAPELSYRLPEFDLTMTFGPTEFTQVNFAVNRVLVGKAVALLAPGPGERIADMFCGLGNFSLAIARRGAEVVGFEGANALVARASRNADRNGLGGLCHFREADLFRQADQCWSARERFDGMLIDPPRDGAIELIKSLPEPSPERIVYVSCNPATLARDAGVLTNVRGYRFTAAGVVNMFPHTAHVESLAVFRRGKA